MIDTFLPDGFREELKTLSKILDALSQGKFPNLTGVALSKQNAEVIIEALQKHTTQINQYIELVKARIKP